MAIPIRPHHGMCFQFFEGKGYNADFTKHLGRLLESLAEAPAQLVLLQLSADAACERCPRSTPEGCADNEKVLRYDEAVLRRCALRAGQTLPYNEFLAAVRREILAPGARAEICGDCAWNTICARKEKEQAPVKIL